MSKPRQWDRAIIVTGHSRGGTTWLGDLLGHAEDSAQIFEPLTHRRHPWTSQVPVLESFDDAPHPWMRSWPPGSPDELAYANAVADHIRQLAEIYIPGHVRTLIVKQPDIQTIPLLHGALQAEKIVYILRDPLSIMNSYDLYDLYRGWRMESQFRLCRDYVLQMKPRLWELLSKADASDELRTLGMSCVAHRIALQWSENPDFHIVNYERLAKGALADLDAVYRDLGLRYRPDARTQLQELFTPAARRRGFLETRKNSRERSTAFLSELAPWQLHRARRYLSSVGYPTPRSQSFWEALAGGVEFTRRRLARVASRARASLSKLRDRVRTDIGSRSPWWGR